MDEGPETPTTDLTWDNVGLAFSFIVLDAVVSRTFGLGVGTSLVTAALRCVAQLTLVALVLQKVFETNNPWAVAAIACAFLICVGIPQMLTKLVVLLNLLGTIETGWSA